MPTISVVMTVYRKYEFLDKAILSILTQTYTEFEFIIVVEYEASVEVCDVVLKYANGDNRIKLYFNDAKLGLSDSLNKGINMAVGEFVARMDDDDISMPNRLEKQLYFMRNNRDIDVCGCLQMTCTPSGEKILYCATDPEELKAEMLFGCQLSHTSVMFRRKLFQVNQWYYEKDSLAEDFKLWLHLLDKIKIANLKDVLVKHRYGFDNISVKKGEYLRKENQELIKKALEKYLHIESRQWRDELFCTWRGFPQNLKEEEAEIIFVQNLEFLKMLDKKNNEYRFVSTEIFVSVLLKRFKYILSHVSEKMGIQSIRDFSNTFQFNSRISFSDNMLALANEIFCTKKSDCIDAWNQVLYFPKNKRIIIWGTGQAYEYFIKRYGELLACSGYIVIGTYNSFMSDIRQMEMTFFIEKGYYDYILVSTGTYFSEIKKYLIDFMKVPVEKIGLLSQLIMAIKGRKVICGIPKM